MQLHRPTVSIAITLATVIAIAASLGTGCTQILGIQPWSTDAATADDAATTTDVAITTDTMPLTDATTSDAGCPSTASCGVCGRTCNTVGEVCESGTCVPAACLAGFGDCNAMPSDGCETPLIANAAHCGSCGRACGDAACTSGACEPSVFVEQDPFISSVAVRNGYVYWTHETPPEIRRAPVGGGPAELACPSPNTPGVLMTDSAGIYWLAINGGAAGAVLKCSSPPCAAPTVLATAALGSDSPSNATSDASRIYWSSGGLTPGLRTVSKAGGGPSTLSNDGDNARGITLIQGVLFLTRCCGTSTGLYSLPATGGTPSRLNSILSRPLATFDNALYSQDSGILYRVSTTGTMTPINTASASVDDIAVDASGIYFYSPSLGGIARIPHAGGVPVLLTRATGVVQIVLDETSVYWAENPSGFVSRAVKRVVK